MVARCFGPLGGSTRNNPCFAARRSLGFHSYTLTDVHLPLWLRIAPISHMPEDGNFRNQGVLICISNYYLGFKGSLFVLDGNRRCTSQKTAVLHQTRGFANHLLQRHLIAARKIAFVILPWARQGKTYKALHKASSNDRPCKRNNSAAQIDKIL